MTTTLVVVDDQKTVREALTFMLELTDDVEVVATAATGAEAVTAAAEYRPDVVLMDVNMPVMNGIEATGRIRAADPAVRIVVLSTFGDDESVRAALRAGASGYLTKDADRATILQVVRGDHDVASDRLARCPSEAAEPAGGAARAHVVAVLDVPSPAAPSHRMGRPSQVLAVAVAALLNGWAAVIVGMFVPLSARLSLGTIVHLCAASLGIVSFAAAIALAATAAIWSVTTSVRNFRLSAPEPLTSYSVPLIGTFIAVLAGPVSLAFSRLSELVALLR